MKETIHFRVLVMPLYPFRWILMVQSYQDTIVNPKTKRVFRSFGEAACETPALLDRFLLKMVLKRANIIP